MALPELVHTAYENQQYNPKLQYLTGVARDDAAYMICKILLSMKIYFSIRIESIEIYFARSHS